MNIKVNLLKNTQQIEHFTSLVKENQGIIFKVSRMYCNSQIGKEDLFQEILLHLWKAFPSYDEQRKFSTWMYRVALNTAISQFRIEKKRSEHSLEDLPINIIDEDSTSSKSDREQLLHRAISRLGKVEKSIIILYMDDYTYDEIAEVIGISVSNVGVKINRIKAKLQQYLKELGYGL